MVQSLLLYLAHEMTVLCHGNPMVLLFCIWHHHHIMEFLFFPMSISNQNNPAALLRLLCTVSLLVSIPTLFPPPHKHRTRRSENATIKGTLNFTRFLFVHVFSPSLVPCCCCLFNGSRLSIAHLQSTMYCEEYPQIWGHMDRRTQAVYLLFSTTQQNSSPGGPGEARPSYSGPQTPCPAARTCTRSAPVGSWRSATANVHPTRPTEVQSPGSQDTSPP